jgi:hypothetical protein
MIGWMIWKSEERRYEICVAIWAQKLMDEIWMKYAAYWCGVSYLGG